MEKQSWYSWTMGSTSSWMKSKLGPGTRGRASFGPLFLQLRAHGWAFLQGPILPLPAVAGHYPEGRCCNEDTCSCTWGTR